MKQKSKYKKAVIEDVLEEVIQEEKPVIVEKKKPRIPTKNHKLIKDGVVIGDRAYKIGDTVSLTEEGRIYFKQQFYIK